MTETEVVDLLLAAMLCSRAAADHAWDATYG